MPASRPPIRNCSRMSGSSSSAGGNSYQPRGLRAVRRPVDINPSALAPILERIGHLGGSGLGRQNDMALAVDPLHGVSRLADLPAGRIHFEAAKGVNGVEREKCCAQFVSIRRAGFLDRSLEHVTRTISAARMVTRFVTVLGLVFLGKFLGARKLKRGFPLGVAHDAFGIESEILTEVR